MKTALHAERDGVIERVVAPVGTPVDATDLLVFFGGRGALALEGSMVCNPPIAIASAFIECRDLRASGMRDLTRCRHEIEATTTYPCSNNSRRWFLLHSCSRLQP